MLDIVAAGPSIQRAHVPTYVRSIGGRPAAQPVLLVGSVDMAGSKRGERYLEVRIARPYEHVAHVTLVATDTQDDDDLSDAVAAAIDAGEAAIRATPDAHGSLFATTADMEPLG